MLSMLSQPKQQNAEATIITLCDRLAHSTLVEDRRAAALALKGFSHSYRELIASSGLQGILDALATDNHDQELRRACLETLIVLFIKTGNGDLVETARRARERNKMYVSPLMGRNTTDFNITGDEISLLLTDRFTQLPENIELLLGFIESQPDVFSTLYSLQLISAIVLNRPDRARETLMSIPNGISLLVRTLESSQEMIRNEGILLLLNLTENDIDSQKLVAFEGTFDSILAIINEEGGLAYGAQSIIEDCLGLLKNLIEYNVSNQKLFCESNLVEKYGLLFDFEPDFAFQNEASVTNITAALHLPRLFCIPGAQSTTSNQLAFGKAGFLLHTLRLAFGPSSPLSVRTSALMTAASLVWQNEQLQQQYVEIDVPYYDLSLSLNILRDPVVVPVTTALVNWMCLLNTSQTFDLRAACLISLCAVFKDNSALCSTFVNDQLTQYKAGISSTENCNIISIVAEYNESVSINPFQSWFACSLLINLFEDSPSVKDQFRAIQIGDEELGQEVAPIIHSIGSQMLASLSYREPFVALGYLQLMSVWLFDDVSAVNEALTESSAIQGLVNYVASNREIKPNVLVQSLATILLGITYDFSSKDSPFSRADLYNLLVNTLGKDQFVHQIRRFRESPVYREYTQAAIFGAEKGKNGLPCVYLERGFYDFISENIARIQKAINKSPDFEPTSRVSLEMYEELKGELIEKEKSLQKYKSDKEQEIKVLVEKESKLAADLAALQSRHEKLETQKAQLDKQHADLEGNYKETSQLLQQTTKQLTDLKTSHEETIKQLDTLKSKYEATEKQHNKLQTQHSKLSEAKDKAETGINKMTRELMTLTREKESIDKDLQKLRAEHEKVSASEKSLSASQKNLSTQLQEVQASHAQLKTMNDKLVAKLRDTAEILKQKEEDEVLLEQAIEDVEKFKAELDAANARIHNFEKENKLIKSKLDTTKKEVSAHSERAKNLESDLKAKIVELKQLELLKIQLDDATKTRDEAVSAAESKVKELETAKSDLENKVSQHALALEKLETEIKAKDSENTKLNATNEQQVSNLKSQHAELQKGLEADLVAKDKELANLKTKLEKLKSKDKEMAGLAADLEKLRKESDKATAELKARETEKDAKVKELHTVGETVAKLEAQLESLQSDLASSEKTVTELKSQHEGSVKDKATSQTLIDEFKGKLSSKNSEVETLKSQAKEAQTTINSLKTKLKNTDATSTNKIKDLESTIKELQSSIKDAKRDRNSLDEKVSSLEAELDAAKSSNKGSSDKHDKLIGAFKDKITAKDEKISQLESDYSAKVAEHEVKLKEFSELQQQLDEATIKLTAVEAKLAESHSELEESLGLDARLKTAETASKKASEKTRELEANLKESEASISTNEKVIKDKEQEISILEGKVQAAQQTELELVKLKSQLGDAKAKDKRITELESKSKESESKDKQIAALEEKLAASTVMAGKVAELEAQLRESQAHAKQADTLQVRIKEMEANDKSGALEKELTSTKSKVAALETKLAERAQTDAAHQDSIKQLESKAQKVDSLQKQVDDLTKTAATSSEEAAKTKTDLDELMELLDELSEQKAKYKGKLKELDQPVSDSEDEDDDDDDEN